MVKAVVGANWGDEGKGKITDMLAEKADIIVRFQGGANAGHTMYCLISMRRSVLQENLSVPQNRELRLFILINMRKLVFR